MKILISLFLLTGFISCSSGKGNLNYEYNSGQPSPGGPVIRRYQEPVDSGAPAQHEDSGSLWTGSGKESHLFTNDETQNYGDIIQINVSSRLQNQILVEIRRHFPGMDSVDINRMVGTIIQQVNKNHLLIRGRKAIHYGNRSKLVEIQALAAKRDLDFNNIIDSDKFLEVTVRVVR